MPAIRIRLLGPPIVERDGVSIQVDTRKAIALLTYLAVSEERQSRDAIVSLLWGELDAAGGRAALRRTLSTLKSALQHSVLEVDRSFIRLRRDAVEIDLDQFRTALQRVRSHGHAVRHGCSGCLPTLLAAASLYRGDFLSGFSLRDALEFDEWQLLHTEAVRRELSDALEGIVAAQSTAGRLEMAIEYAQRWLALDPLNEAAHRALLQLYSRSGQRSSALRQYRDCVRILEEELSVPPVEETTRLYQAIKEHGDKFTGAIVGSEPVPANAELPAPRRLPLVGRTTEWKALLGAFEVVQRGAHVVALEGEAGIGKTRLVAELLDYARANGASTLTSRCFEGETRLAYAPVIQLLRGAFDLLRQSGELERVAPGDSSEIGRLLPEIRAVQPTAVTASPWEIPAAHTRMLEAIGNVLLASGGDRPLLIAVDDLQWADAASLECIAYVLRRLGRSRVGIVLAWRTDGPTPLHVVRRAIVDSQRLRGATVLQLDRLTQDSVFGLVETVAPDAESPDRSSTLGDWLYQETEGLPLFIDEYLAAITGGFLDKSLPLGVSDLLLSRLAVVSDTGWQFLAAAAAIGRSFDFDILRETSGRDEDMAVSGLEELCRQGLIREVETGVTETPSYDFSHDKLRSLVYDRTGMARRRLLHRRVADALATKPRVKHDHLLDGQIAHHYHRAGLPAQAAEYYQQAGDHARSLYANREAIAHYEAALALGHLAIPELHEALGDVHVILGEYRRAAERYESAAAVSDGRNLARIEHKLGTVHHRWGEWELAESYFEEALKTLGDGTSEEHARIYADWSMAAYHRDQVERSRQLAQMSLTLAEQSGGTRALAQAHNMLGILENSLGHHAAARDYLTRSLALAEMLPDSGVRVAALQNLALLNWKEGLLDEARRFTSEALELSSVRGDRHREAALHNTMADLIHAGGGSDDATAHVRQAVAIYAEIGVDAGTMRPEVWKLTEW